MYNENNIFNQIISKKINCDPIYEDDMVLAFNDTQSQAPIHILVISKGKFVSFDDFAANCSYIDHFFKTVQKIAQEQNLSENGYRLVTNHGKHSGQEVPHFHVHIIGGKTLGPIA